MESAVDATTTDNQLASGTDTETFKTTSVSQNKKINPKQESEFTTNEEKINYYPNPEQPQSNLIILQNILEKQSELSVPSQSEPSLVKPKRRKSLKKKGQFQSSQNHMSSDSDFSDENSPQTKGPQMEREDTIIQGNDMMFPPPEDLIAKSLFIQEPIKTGAPINFIKIDELKGIEKQKEDLGKKNEKEKTKNIDYSEFGGLNKPGTKSLAEDMVRHYNEGRVVYCKFGKKYIENIEKQINSLAPGQTQSTSLRSATFLINIKKLIKEHNIESENFFKINTRSNVTQKTEPPPTCLYYTPENEDDQTLVFESRFESANLLCAIKISDTEYDLILSNDINTNGHTQWYFFRVSNTRKQAKVKFNILNLAKPDSLYNQGMKVLSFSAQAKKEHGLGWHRVGSDIYYTQNTYKRENLRFSRYYYTLTFTHDFTHSNDTVYFSHCFPYTYSDLSDDLSRIEKDPYTQNFCYRNSLCRSLAGNKCEYLTVTSKEKDPKGEISTSKRGVVLSARVHPGESNASWMMKGAIDYLVSNTPEARVLRNKFVFKIVPMINPDGVINGNYRCSLAGSDLNRRYKAPQKLLHPVVYSIKRLVKNLSKEREMALFCDFHGHSRRKNIFMYGNNYPERPDKTRVFPYIISKLCDYFSFEYSRFSVHRSKEATARVALWRDIGNCPLVYTMEASFSGADKGLLKDQHFTTEHLMAAGRKVLEALLVYYKIDVAQSINEIKQRTKKKDKIEGEDELKVEFKQEKLNVDSLMKELNDNKELIKLTSGKDDDGESSGSDSAPSEDNLDEDDLAKVVPIKIKKKKPVEKSKTKPIVPIKKKMYDIISQKYFLVKKKLSKNLQNKFRRAFSDLHQLRDHCKFLYLQDVSPNPLYDRLKLRQKKIEMKDAWTQTSDRGSDNEDARQKRNATTPTLIKQHKQGILPISDQRNQQYAANSSDRFLSDLSPLKTVMQDNGHSPQPQIRVRKDPIKNNQVPHNISQFEEKLLNQQIPLRKRDLTEIQSPNQKKESFKQMMDRMDTDEGGNYDTKPKEKVHSRHYSIENSQQIINQSGICQSNRMSSRSKKMKQYTSDNETSNVSLLKREKNLTSPKNKDISNIRAAQRVSNVDPRYRQSVMVTKEGQEYGQGRGNIYSSLDKSQHHIVGQKNVPGLLPELNESYMQKQKYQDMNYSTHNASGILNKQTLNQKYSINSSAQNLQRNQNLFKLQQQMIRAGGGKIEREDLLNSGKSVEKIRQQPSQNVYQNIDLQQQKSSQQQFQLQNVKLRHVLDGQL